MVDFVQELGPRLLGTRIRRLSESMDRAAKDIYREQGIRFEPRWAALLNLLSRTPSVTVTEAAGWLGQSHVSLVKIVNDLLREDLVVARVDATDRRKRNVRLTARGKRLVKRLEPIWLAVAIESEALLLEVAPQLLQQLESLEASLERRSLTSRFRARLEDQKACKKGRNST